MEKKRKYTSSQFRFERKFFITQLSSLDIEYIIKVNPAIFSEIFNKRNVNNIYFDTLNLDNYLENFPNSASIAFIVYVIPFTALHALPIKGM